MIPVYMINGFLDSGKSMFIQYTISQPYFQTKGTTLVIVCEEGEVEYDPELLKRSHAVMELIEEEKDFTGQTLIALEKKHRPVRILIEFNGMWNSKNVKFPWHWKLEQQITLIDGSTFSSYFTNMKSLIAEHIRRSEMIMVNRCDSVMEKIPSYKRNIKAINQNAEIIFEDQNGEVNATLEEELPYDVNAEVIDLDDTAYGVWYIDVLDNAPRYAGKTISYIGQVLKPKEFPKGYFVPGRMAMTCCADDMAFLGYACRYPGADELNEQDWIRVKAKVGIEYFEDYGKEGPVLEAVSIEKTKKPREPVINFV